MIPFRYFTKNERAKSLLQLFKLLQLHRILELIEPKALKEMVKSYYARKLRRDIQMEDFRENRMTDYNNIMDQIILSFIVRIIRLIAIVITISYFIGTMWYLFCWLLWTEAYDEQGSYSFIGYFMFEK